MTIIDSHRCSNLPPEFVQLLLTINSFIFCFFKCEAHKLMKIVKQRVKQISILELYSGDILIFPPHCIKISNRKTGVLSSKASKPSRCWHNTRHLKNSAIEMLAASKVHRVTAVEKQCPRRASRARTRLNESEHGSSGKSFKFSRSTCHPTARGRWWIGFSSRKKTLIGDGACACEKRERRAAGVFAGAERNIDCRRVGVAVEGPASQLTRVASSQLIDPDTQTHTERRIASRRNYRRIAALRSPLRVRATFFTLPLPSPLARALRARGASASALRFPIFSPPRTLPVALPSGARPYELCGPSRVSCSSCPQSWPTNSTGALVGSLRAIKKPVRTVTLFLSAEISVLRKSDAKTTGHSAVCCVRPLDVIEHVLERMLFNSDAPRDIDRSRVKFEKKNERRVELIKDGARWESWLRKEHDAWQRMCMLIMDATCSIGRYDLVLLTY